MKRLILLFSALWLLSSATALTDLGEGLSYLRIRSLGDAGATLQKTVAATGALVLDLRYATATAESSAVLQNALARRSSSTPLFILVSPATPPGLEPIISASPALTLGVAGSLPRPKVVIQTAATTDRAAFDALESGATLEKLISGKIEKERFDEASLVQEFKHGNPLPGDRPGQTPAGQQPGTVPPTPDPTLAPPAGPVDEPVALTDRVLQRAVHLHRALLALKNR